MLTYAHAELRSNADKLADAQTKELEELRARYADVC
jgi:hypothetical protein